MEFRYWNDGEGGDADQGRNLSLSPPINRLCKSESLDHSSTLTVV